MVGIGFLAGGDYSSADAVSADGSRVVGSRLDPFFESEIFIWEPRTGIRNLSVVLTGLGLDLTGWTLTSAEDITPDGQTLVGSGTNPSGNLEAWLAVVPEPGADLLGTMGALSLVGLAARRRRRAAD